MSDRYGKNLNYTKTREEIRQDMEDYKILCSRVPDIDGEEYKLIFDSDIYHNFKIHLENRIDKNIIKIIGKPLI